MSNQNLSNVAAIRKFFGEGKHGSKVEMSELKVLSAEDRQELGDLCRKELE
jgi:hypothetical protein